MNRSLLLPVHEAAGARLTGGEPPQLLTYGDVPAEYAAAQEGCVLFDQTDRGRVVVGGEEAREFLHRLLANPVRTLEPGQGNRNLLLTSKGKVQFDLDLALEPDRVLLSTQPGEAAGLIAALDMYLFAEKVELADGTEEHAPLALAGPRARAAVEDLLGATLGDDHARVEGRLDGAPVQATPMPVAGSPGVRVDGGPELATALWNGLRERGAIPAGLVVRDILRVEAGAAQPGVDVDDNVYPQEARLEAAFSLDKGCYIGQEVVAKIDTYGGLNKRLVALKVSHDDPVPRGTRLVAPDDGDRDLGMVTSWAYSFVLDTGLVLAYVKRKHQAVGTTFRVGDTPAEATVVELPVREGAVAVTGELE